MNGLPQGAWEALTSRVQVLDATEIWGGTNNRLVRIETPEGLRLAKFYARDRWNRLGTEYPALEYLARRGIAGAPQPILRDDEHRFGVYTFEEGERRAPSTLGPDEMRAAARLAAELHAFPPDGDEVGVAEAACLSLAGYVRMIEARLSHFESDPLDEVRGLDVRARVEACTTAAVAGLSDEEIARPLPREAWRLNTYDYGPHNWLFRDDGGLTVVDFEGAGWDDPARMVMGVVSTPGGDGMSDEARSVFLGEYAARRGLCAEEVARCERVGRLLDVEWATTYAWVLTDDAIVAKQFGTEGFDRRRHVEECLAKLEERLARAEAGRGYAFP